MAPLNVALCGFGYAGQTFHAPLIAAEPGLRLHSVVSSRPDAVAAAWPAARVVGDLDTALGDPAIDLVVIATPNRLHAPQAQAALLAGKAVVVDKPFALNVAEAQALVDLAASTGHLLSVFHNRRWDADFLTLRALIAGGELGRISRFESHFNRFRPVTRDRWRERPGPGAGIWHDLGPHLIDQALVLFGPPLGITADIASQRDPDGAPDYFHAVLRYERLRVILHADVLSPAPGPRFVAQGDRAGFVASGLDVQEEQLKAGGTPGGAGWGVDPAPGAVTDGASGRTVAVAGVPGDYRRYYADIASALAGKGPNPVPPGEALAVMALIDAGLESSRRRAEVSL